MIGSLSNDLAWGFRTKFYMHFIFPPHVMCVLLFLLFYVEPKEKILHQSVFLLSHKYKYFPFEFLSHRIPFSVFRTKFYMRFLFPPHVMYVLLFLLFYVESKEKILHQSVLLLSYKYKYFPFEFLSRRIPFYVFSWNFETKFHIQQKSGMTIVFHILMTIFVLE